MDYQSRMGGTTMRIKLEKKAEEYKPVKGNELEIIKHLLDHVISFEIEENWGSTSFNNEKDVFFKCEKNGQIKIRDSEPKPKKCIGVIFDVFNVDVIEILQAKNFKGLRKDSPFSKGDEWELKTTTDTFKVCGGDLVVIDDDEKIIDCLRHEINSGNFWLSDEYRIKMRD